MSYKIRVVGNQGFLNYKIFDTKTLILLIFNIYILLEIDFMDLLTEKLIFYISSLIPLRLVDIFYSLFSLFKPKKELIYNTKLTRTY